MMGLERPRPGRSTFQDTFSVAPQRTGKPVSVDTPRPRGPRNCRQSSAYDAAGPRSKRRRVVVRLMVFLSRRPAISSADHPPDARAFPRRGGHTGATEKTTVVIGAWGCRPYKP